MLISLISDNLILKNITKIHDRDKLEKYIIPSFNRNAEVIKQATGKTWEEILILLDEIGK